jgi:TPR repeat protein
VPRFGGDGEPIIWDYQPKQGMIEIFDLMGFHPDTGEELLPITKEIAALWKKQQLEKAQRPPKRITDPENYVFFDLRTGEARGWYWVSPNGRYEFYDNSGFHPQAGDKLQIVTRGIISAWKDQQETTALRPPNKVQITEDTVFFDLVIGNPRLWYWRKDKGEYEFFDGPGFHPQNGQSLQSFTKDMLIQYQQEIGEREKQLKAEQNRIEAEQKAKREAENRRQLELQKKTEEEERRRKDEAKRLSEAAKQCDDLAANPNDANRVGVGVYYDDLKPRAAEAVAACEAASKQNPSELRCQYQLARALELTGDGVARAKNRQRALEIHQVLVKAGYPAAYDNLGSMYISRDRYDLGKAVAIFRRGVALNDSDSMISLAGVIVDGRVAPQAPGETPIELYKRAAELGNQNAERGYKALVAKDQLAQQQQIQQLQQQRLFLQFMGTVLRNVR